MLASVKTSRNILKFNNLLQFRQFYLNSIVRTSDNVSSSIEAPSAAPEVVPLQKKVTSKAMRAYLERAKEHEQFMAQQNHEYQIGKRHLANMMGEDPETFTQEDIDNAIEYLFPSGLFEKRARPSMRPPDEVFPERKAAEFDETGRPHHFLFYTGKPNFYKLLFDITEKIIELNKFEDAMIRKDLEPDPNLKLNLSGYQWLQKDLLEKKMVELLTDKEYDAFVAAMERICSLPYSYRVKDFILEYNKPLLSQTKSFAIPQLQYDADGRGFITTYECLRKRARAHVTLRTPGTGQIIINDKDLNYFEEKQCREQVGAFYLFFLCSLRFFISY